MKRGEMSILLKPDFMQDFEQNNISVSEPKYEQSPTRSKWNFSWSLRIIYSSPFGCRKSLNPSIAKMSPNTIVNIVTIAM